MYVGGYDIVVVCNKHADIGILLDHSTSIVDPARGGNGNWEVSMKGFIAKLIESFPVGPTQTRFGIVSFNSTAWLSFGFNAYNHSRTLLSAVNNLELSGGLTNAAEVNDDNDDGDDELISYVRPLLLILVLY